ncbi:hypothetical protein K2173_004947 [Erythroxylum novogranatense]|uniref:CCHC-type domain-containing protein n=1 Tax=Erythroxylum novogranatense TaxID=1862640 RepID=A0AAV8TDC3_9ROSI|nr:hypothetical protein K2173_004947 [Erythroxylum novogranatense]
MNKRTQFLARLDQESYDEALTQDETSTPVASTGRCGRCRTARTPEVPVEASKLEWEFSTEGRAHSKARSSCRHLEGFKFTPGAGACYRCGQYGHLIRDFLVMGYQQSSSSMTQPPFQLPQGGSQFNGQQGRGFGERQLGGRSGGWRLQSGTII